MDYRGGDEFVKLQTASEENSMTGGAYNTKVEKKNFSMLAKKNREREREKKNEA